LLNLATVLFLSHLQYSAHGAYISAADWRGPPQRKIAARTTKRTPAVRKKCESFYLNSLLLPSARVLYFENHSEEMMTDAIGTTQKKHVSTAMILLAVSIVVL
jgi:hypothetical protein